MNFIEMFGVILAVAMLGGGLAGLLGIFVIGLRVPFLTVCVAHAALAGAIFGTLLGLSASWTGFAGALAGALLLGRLTRLRNLDPNAALGTLFSLALGLAFLGMGLGEGPKSGMLSLLWGSLLFVTPAQLAVITALAVGLTAFVVLFEKELKLLLFSRELAATLIPESAIFTTLMVLSAAVISVNLEIVGGLLLYSLICNPAVAALKLARSYRAALVWGAGLGAASAVGGFVAAYLADLPVGACIVLCSILPVGIALLMKKGEAT